MKMKASISYLVLSLTLILISCADSDEIKPAPINDVYDVERVSYGLISTNGSTEEVAGQVSDLVYTNRSSLRQGVIINYENLFETSEFVRDPDGYTIANNKDILFKIPLNIDNNMIILGNEKWAYAESIARTAVNNVPPDSIYIEPGYKVLITSRVIYRKVRATYVATMRGQKTNNSVTITGKWTGNYPIRSKIFYTSERL